MNHENLLPQAPRLSIVISTLNAAQTLSRCLDSIAAQGFREFEVIIIDGGSSDGTSSVAAGYGSLIARFQSEPDSGIYDAWNKALLCARGEWICFLGADDCYTSSEALGTFAAAAAFPETTLVSARVAMINSSGAIVRTHGIAWHTETMKRYMCIAHAGAWHHRSLFEAYGRFSLAYRLAGDYEFLLRAAASVRATFIPDILVRMQIGGISTSKYWLHVKEGVSILNATPAAGCGYAILFLIRASVGRAFRKLRLRSGDGR